MHPQSTPSQVCPVCGTSFMGYTKFCSRACYRAQGPSRPLAERFWEKVQRAEGCWLWTSAVNTSGYGIICIARRAVEAHRIAYELTYGPIPAGLWCCHTCDQRLCVRPDHLFVADRAVNWADCKAKGRARNGSTGPLPRSPLTPRLRVPRLSVEERFWKKVVKTDDCWLWTGCRNRLGYGQIYLKGGKIKAHRLAWELTHGPIAPGLFCCHHCDAPSCVRPDHLFLGTVADNNADMWIKDRGHRPTAFPFVAPERRLLGERNHNAKVTAEQVREIRRRYSDGETLIALSHDFPLAFPNIWKIVKRKTWRHVL